MAFRVFSINSGSNSSLKAMKVYDKVGDEIFGNSKVVEILGCSETTATAYIKILSTELNLIDPVAGHGKGKYIFKK